MRKTDPAVIERIREHARLHPEDTYGQIALAFDLSLPSVKRFCADLGRSKAWRRGRNSEALDAERLWSQVDREEGQCWPWNGCKNSNGYGFMHMRGRRSAPTGWQAICTLRYESSGSRDRLTTAIAT
jgi:hypothetical protein